MILFLHGVPDTAALWGPLIKALRLGPQEVTALNMPGFSAPVPQGFGCSMHDYAAWLEAELERVTRRLEDGSVADY